MGNTESRLEKSSKAKDTSSTRDSKLCEACQKITLENLGCCSKDFETSFSSDGSGNFDKYTGFEYPHTVGDLDESRKRCELCALLWRVIHPERDSWTSFAREPTSRIKLAYDRLQYCGSSKEETPRSCLRIHLEKPFKSILAGNYSPLFLRVYVKPEDEEKIAAFGFGRQIVPADSEIAFERISSSLDDCIKNHPACARTINGEVCEERTTLPARLIDLGTGPEDLPVIVETSGSTGKYVALSYCWGNVSGPVLETTTSTIEEFKKGIPLEHMPKTTKDAMAITKRLGFRYLWIDRLCIIQDNGYDWDTEALKMGRIYESAVCTIAALGAKDSEEGLFLPRDDEKAVELPCDNVTLLLSSLKYHINNGPMEGTTQLAHEMSGSKWATRAWVFQERLFSRRTIMYGRTQNFWECRMQLDSETRFGDDAGFTYECSKYQYCKDFKKQLNQHVYHQSRSSAATVSNPNQDRSIWNLLDYVWSEIIAQYSKLNLTDEEDRLPAMAGLAEAVKQQTGEEVCAGMWLGSLPQSLFWWPCWWSDSQLAWQRKYYPEMAGTFVPRPVRSSKYNAPSWSWLAAGTPVSFYPFFRATELSIERPKFIREDTISNNTPKTSYKLELWVHIITAHRREEQLSPRIRKDSIEELNQIPRDNGTAIHDRWEADGMYALVYYNEEKYTDGMVLFDDTEVAPLSFECAIIGAGPGINEDKDRTTIYFLMIQPTSSPGEYVRIGIGIRCLEKGVDYLQRLPPKQCIVLV